MNPWSYAFPQSARAEADRALSQIDLYAKIEPNGRFTASVGGEIVSIPQRVYFENTSLLPLKPRFRPSEWALVNALYTRHHDGFVRQQCLKEMVTYSANWTTPFVMRLVGEYVLEILQVIHDHLDRLDPQLYAEFIAENAGEYERTRARVVSYWNCYYRGDYWKRTDYVGFKLIDFFDRLRP